MVQALRKTRMLCWPIMAMVVAGCLPFQVRDDQVYKGEGPLPVRQEAQAAGDAPRAERVTRLQQPTQGQEVKKASYANIDESRSVPYKLRVCAWVNSTPIFTHELFGQAARDLANLQGTTEPAYSIKREKILKKELQLLIDQEVVYQDALAKLKQNPTVLKKIRDFADKRFNESMAMQRARLGVKEAEFKRQMKAQGLSEETVRQQFRRNVIVNEYIRSRAKQFDEKIGRLEIREYYEQHANEFQTLDRVEWQDIFIAAGTKKHPTMDSARQFAEQLLRRLQAGEPFANFLSYDDGDSVIRKGKGFGQRRGEIKPPELERYLFTMKPGQIGMVEITTGFHVFRLAKREFAGQLPFDDTVQAKIREKLQTEQYLRERRRIIRQLASRTVIEINEKAFR